MKVTVTKKIGKATLQFSVEGEKEVDTLAKASFYTTAPDKCGLCKSENITLDSNKAKGFTFVKIKCLDCNGRANMGQFKDGSGCFWKDWEVYQKPTEKAEPEVGDEEVPDF